MIVRAPFVVFASSLSLVAACSSSSGGGAPASANVPIEQVVPLLAQAECDLLTQCFGSLKSVLLGPGDCVTTQSRTLTAQSLGPIEALVASGKLTYDGTKVQECVDGLKAQGCTPANTTPDVCKQVFTGTVAAGGACAQDEECAGHGACVGHGMCPGACQARGAVGAACARSAECNDGFVCDGKACVTPAAVGQACDAGSPPCGGALLCANTTTDPMTGKKTPGTCAALTGAFSAAVGAACDITKSQFCATGAFCALTTLSPLAFQCVGPSNAGGACKSSVPDACPAGQYCNADVAKGKPDGVCAPLVADGSPCAASFSGDGCKGGSVCDGGTCRPRADNGGACASATSCYSGLCTGGTCQPGASCSKM